MQDHLAAQAQAADMTIEQLAAIASDAESHDDLSPIELAAQDELDRRTSGSRIRPLTQSHPQ